jgi:acetyltransferase-like isoleucine patch superfamily enzyme
MLNKIKNYIGLFFRKYAIWYYRKLGVQIGNNVFIGRKAKIDTTYPNSVVVGDGCFITFGAIILAHDHSVYRHTPFTKDDGKGKVILEKNVFVGAHAIILRNVRIGENAIIAAGAVVTKDVPPNVIVAGNPARIVREFAPK